MKKDMKLGLFRDGPVLILDGSYIIFHRFHATAKWLAFKREGLSLGALSDDPEFVKAFNKHLHDSIADLMKKNRVPRGNVVWCCDCKRDQIWRNRHHDDYKGKRSSGNFDPRIFARFHVETAPVLQEAFGVQMVSSDGLEADDLVYLVCQTIGKHAPHPENVGCIVITNDNDFLQLGTDQIRICNMSGKDIKLRGKGSAHQDMWLKIIMGDKSDNIQSIGSKCGPKTAWQIVQAASLSGDGDGDGGGERDGGGGGSGGAPQMVDVDRLEAIVRGRFGEEGVTRLYQNRLLVDMSQIPPDLHPNMYIEWSSKN